MLYNTPFFHGKVLLFRGKYDIILYIKVEKQKGKGAVCVP